MYDTPAVSGTLAAAGTLPFTGLNLMVILAIAVVLLVAGSLTYLVANRNSAIESA